tara:strand:- start:9 stop:524 length:516 start_codon:yes stop_codon:yes gene_type:complete
MRKTELKEKIQNEIFSVLAEADTEDIKAQQDLNKELETTKGHKDELGDSLSENLNPEVHRLVNSFINKMANKYDIPLQDAVYNIMTVLRSQNYDGLNEAEDMSDEEMDKKAAKAAKKGGSVSTISNKLQQTTKEMKSVVNKWKDADGAEKDKLTSRLKELTKIKKELEGLL